MVEDTPAFIRALTTAVTESAIDGMALFFFYSFITSPMIWCLIDLYLNVIVGYGTESKLNSDTLKKWTEVLRRYVENIADRELQLLFAVQTLVTQRQHPKGFILQLINTVTAIVFSTGIFFLGLIQGIFETLYDCNVVSEEGFISWTTSDDPSEREGKSVALKSITSFLTWLNEAEAESDQEVDGWKVVSISWNGMCSVRVIECVRVNAARVTLQRLSALLELVPFFPIMKETS